jgi:hypothetical protein
MFCEKTTFYVITVGLESPVILASCEICKATLTRLCKALVVASNNLSGLLSYFSKYIRTVAPEPAVPDKRKTIREPSVNKIRIP